MRYVLGIVIYVGLMSGIVCLLSSIVGENCFKQSLLEEWAKSKKNA